MTEDEVVDADDSGEFDFLQEGTMKELAMKMDLIDQQLADLTQASSSNIKSSSIVGNSTAEYSTADFDVDASALSSLQDELREVQEAADHDKEEVAAAAAAKKAKEESAPPLAGPAAIEQPVVADKKAPGTDNAATKPATPPAIVVIDGKKHKILHVSAAKPDPTSKVGISMKTSKGVTMIVAINADGLLANTKLKEGQKLIKVNGIDVKNARHARVLIQSAASKVSIDVLQELNEGEE